VAFIGGAPVVIADLTATRFCDSAALQHLLHARRKAAASGTQLRLAIDPRGPIARVIELTGISRHVPVYPTLQQAAHCSPLPG
jgi:anti-sigma B factor antagonist